MARSGVAATEAIACDSCPRRSRGVFSWLGCLSGVGCSVLVVDGGRGEEPTPQREAVSWFSGTASDDASGRFVGAAARARAARDAADAEALASDAFLVE